MTDLGANAAAVDTDRSVDAIPQRSHVGNKWRSVGGMLYFDDLAEYESALFVGNSDTAKKIVERHNAENAHRIEVRLLAGGFFVIEEHIGIGDLGRHERELIGVIADAIHAYRSRIETGNQSSVSEIGSLRSAAQKKEPSNSTILAQQEKQP